MSDPTPDAHLSPDEAMTLASVLDEIVPPSDDGRLPGAGELGLVGYVEQKLREMPDLRPAVVQGLEALARLSAERGAASFPALSREDRVDLLNQLASSQPAFLPGLVFHTYSAYYQEPRVLEALGMPPRAPHPQGYEVPPTDFSILDPVRMRTRVYREA